MKHTLTLLVFAFLIVSCVEKKPRTKPRNQDNTNGFQNIVASSSITPVLKTDPEEFQLRGTHARLIRTENGTRIHIPANAFTVKSTGEYVEGDVILTFNEYHTQGEILASGIPMTYSIPEEDTVDFESAGVFAIRAFQDGLELELADDKVIEMELATNMKGPSEFYAFDEELENWVLNDTALVPIVNPYIAKQIMELEKLEAEMPETPKELIEYEAGDHLFDVKRYSVKDEELDVLDGVFWKFTGDSTQVDPSEGNATFNDNYDFVELTAVDSSLVREYDMVFQNGSEVVVLRAAPVFQGKLLTREKDRMSRILRQIEYATQSKEEIELELELEKPLMRMTSINGTGIYSFGGQFKDDNAHPISAVFTFDSLSLDQAMLVYVLPLEKRCVINYTPLTFKDFKINPNEVNRLVAINPEDKSVYVLSSADLASLNLSRKAPGELVHFDLKKHSGLIENSVDLDELISTL